MLHRVLALVPPCTFSLSLMTPLLVVMTAFLALMTQTVAAAPPDRPAGRASDPRPNIVLVLSDDQGWTDYGFMDHPTIQTPNLDRLARQGTLFRRGYVPTALCRPSLMSIVTGHYASVHGVTGNDPSPKYGNLQSEDGKRRRAKLIANIDRFETLPERLVESGYLAHQSGKWWEGHWSRGGFTAGMTRGFPNRGGRHGDDGLKIGRQGLQPIKRFVGDAAGQGNPYFLWYAPFLPHSPHNPPEEFLAKYRRPNVPESIAKYQAMCEWFDTTCGELMDLVQAHNGGRETFVVYVCDNGWVQGPKTNKFALRSKQSPYDFGVRTPIFYWWPGKIPAADRPELASSLDLYPTILAAAGLPVPDGLPGLNLLPAITQPAPIRRDSLFGESFAHDIANLDDPEQSLLFRWVIQDQWKLLLTYDGETNRYTQVHPRTERGPQLFDLNADPNETKNLADQHPDLVATLTKRIEDDAKTRSLK
ncbi:MAG: sulfatase-like hydrolase/transferase [Planctomycetota bacterium]